MSPLLFWTWFRDRRRRKLLAEPFPQEWNGYLQRNVPEFSHLTVKEQAKLRDDLRIFMAEKFWEGCNGLTVTDEMRVTIAATACLLTLHLSDGFLDHVHTILIYPGDYVVQDRSVGPDGVVREGPSARHGEAWLRGPVVLSWTNTQESGQNERDGSNLVLHEFAHQIDMRDGEADGIPPLEPKTRERWQHVLQQEQSRLNHALRSGRPTVLDPYAATNAQEFFAVATECFFERPGALRRAHGELYELMRDFFGQDPAARV